MKWTQITTNNSKSHLNLHLIVTDVLVLAPGTHQGEHSRFKNLLTITLALAFVKI